MATPTQQGTPDMDTRLVFVIGVTAVILLFVVVIGIEAGFRQVWNHEVYTKVYESQDPELVELKHQQQKQISSVQWRDKDKQLVTVPVEVAMQRMLDESTKDESSKKHEPKQ